MKTHPYQRWIGWLCALTVCGCTDPGVIPADEAQRLLKGVRPAPGDLFGSTRFRLTQNTIQVDVRFGPGGPSARLLLDSGAPMTIATPLFQALALEPLATVALAGPEGGRSNASVVRIPVLNVAGATFHDVGSIVGWVSAPNAVACLSRDGLLGASLLQAAIWQIDFEAGTLTATDSLGSLPGIDAAVRIAFVRADASGSPRIEVGVSDDDHVSLLIDLGFNGSFAMPAKLFERTGNRFAKDAPVGLGDTESTAFGARPSPVRVGRLRELRLGDLTLPDMPVLSGGSISDFHVGIGFLRHFRVTLDWRSDSLYLERRDPVPALYDQLETYGFKPQFRDGVLEVGSLWQDSGAARSGLAVGDRIIELDGQSTEVVDFAAFCNILDAIGMYGWKRDRVAVTVSRDGQRESVSLERRSPL